MSVEVLGLDKVIARVVKLPIDLDVESPKALKKIGRLMKEYAKQIVAVDTGSLKRSIRLQIYAKPKLHIHRVGVSAGGYIVNPKTGKYVNYAKYVEWGTSKMPAQPFMRPAMAKYAHLIPKEIKTQVKH